MGFFAPAKGTVNYTTRKHGRHIVRPDSVAKVESDANVQSVYSGTMSKKDIQKAVEIAIKHNPFFLPVEGGAEFDKRLASLASECKADYQQVKKKIQELAIIKAILPEIYERENVLEKEAAELQCHDSTLLKELVDEQPLKKVNMAAFFNKLSGIKKIVSYALYFLFFVVGIYVYLQGK